MPEYPITQAKRDQLSKRMQELGILEEDLSEQFVRGSGKGGQKVNKTASCVHLQHEPSGIVVKCQKTRSRESNRFFARRELCEQMAEQIDGEQSRRQQEQERIRRQKRRRSRRQKEKMLKDKHHQSEKKARRGRVDPGAE